MNNIIRHFAPVLFLSAILGGCGDDALFNKDEVGSIRQEIFIVPERFVGDPYTIGYQPHPIYLETDQVVKFWASYIVNDRYISPDIYDDYITQKIWDVNGEYFNLNSFRYSFSEPGLKKVTLKSIDKLNDTITENLDVYVNGDRAYNILYNQTQAAFTPINFNWRSFNLQLGIRWDYMHYNSNLNSDSTGVSPIKNEHFFSYRARITYNNEDNWIFPTRGARFNAGYVYLTTDFARLEEYSPMGTYLGKKTGLSIVNADWRISIPFGARLTIQPMFYGRLLFGSVVPHIFSNTIGGDWFGHYMEQQMPFAGVGCMEYVENQFVAAQLQAQQRMGKNHYILLRVACAQNSDKMNTLLDRRTLIGVQGAYYYNTMFGPLGATLGYSNRT